MSLVTLGSVAYNPYNTSLAEMAVTGVKLGMENLDRMEENNRFSISETTKAFAAVTDNLFKGQEMQLRGRESDRADRAQAFHEYEFGEKMEFDEKRAKVGDDQWLKSFDQRTSEFEDTKIRTGLLAEEGKQRKAEFNEQRRKAALNEPFENIERWNKMQGLLQAPRLAAEAVDREAVKEAMKSLEDIRTPFAARIQENQRLLNTVMGSQGGSGGGSAPGTSTLEGASNRTKRVNQDTGGPPVGRGANQQYIQENGPALDARAAELKRQQDEEQAKGKGTRLQFNDPAYTARLESQLKYDYDIDRRIAQLQQLIGLSPDGIKAEGVAGLRKQLEEALKEGAKAGYIAEPFDPNKQSKPDTAAEAVRGAR